MIIKSNLIDEALKTLSKQYHGLIQTPRYYLQQAVHKDFKQYHNENHKFVKMIHEVMKEPLYQDLDITWIISDMAFDLNDRAGWWQEDTLYLVIASFQIEEAFDTDQKLKDWLKRGINYYLVSKEMASHTIGYMSVNRKCYDYDYIFKVFYQMVTSDPNLAISIPWWQDRGVALFAYGKDTIMNLRNQPKQSVPFYLEAFQKLIKAYDKDFASLTIPASIGKCFEPGYLFLAQQVCDDSVKADIYDFLYHCYDEDEDLMKNVVFVDTYDETSSYQQVITWIQDDSVKAHTCMFELTDFGMDHYHLYVRYHAASDIKQIKAFQKTIQTMAQGNYELTLGV